MKHEIVSFVFLGIAVILGCILVSIPSGSESYLRIALAYGFVVIFGFASSLILGEMYKIIPFLVWLNKYAPRAGIAVVPTMKEMVNDRLAKAELVLFCAGVIIAGTGLIIQPQMLFGIGSLLLAGSSILFGLTIIGIYRR
jgi:hypothetical protein